MATIRSTASRLAALAILPFGTVLADESYPTDPNQMDKLCRAIQMSPSTAVKPADVVWYDDNCIMVKFVGAAHPSERLCTRIAERIAEAQTYISNSRESADRYAREMAERESSETVPSLLESQRTFGCAP